MKTRIEITPEFFFGSKKVARKAVKKLKKRGWPIYLVEDVPVWCFSSSELYLMFADDFTEVREKLQPTPRWVVMTQLDDMTMCEVCHCESGKSSSWGIEHTWGSFDNAIYLEVKNEDARDTN